MVTRTIATISESERRRTPRDRTKLHVEYPVVGLDTPQASPEDFDVRPTVSDLPTSTVAEAPARTGISRLWVLAMAPSTCTRPVAVGCAAWVRLTALAPSSVALPRVASATNTTYSWPTAVTVRTLEVALACSAHARDSWNRFSLMDVAFGRRSSSVNVNPAPPVPCSASSSVPPKSDVVAAVSVPVATIAILDVPWANNSAVACADAVSEKPVPPAISLGSTATVPQLLPQLVPHPLNEVAIYGPHSVPG